MLDVTSQRNIMGILITYKIIVQTTLNTEIFSVPFLNLLNTWNIITSYLCMYVMYVYVYTVHVF